MKATGPLYSGDAPVWGLQTKKNEAAPAASAFQRGWDQFYDRNGEGHFSAYYESGRPHLRTFGLEAEKFYEAFKQPHVPGRPPKPPPCGTGRPGESWGIGGSLPTGTRRLLPFPHKEEQWSKKKHLVPSPAQDFFLEDSMGCKKHVYLDGVDCAHRRSGQGCLEDALQRRARVPEEARSEKRTIHRMAPPGLKGYMGAEYSNNYWKMDGVVPRTKMRMSREDQAAQVLFEAAERSARLGKPKSFKQKRAEEELAEQVGLVGTLALEYDYLDDDEDYIDDHDDEDYSDIIDNSKSNFSQKTSKQYANNHNKLSLQNTNFANLAKKSAQKVS